jgi:group II intron reverse transcriptase/maturase
MPLPPWLDLPSLRRAFARVQENHGCAGADGVSLPAFHATRDDSLATLRAAVENESYYAWPLRRVLIEKHPGSPETRTLLVPTIADRVLQTATAAYLEPYLEKEFDDCSFAYRRGRSVRMAVDRVYTLYQQGYTWLLDADIDDFFSTVPRTTVTDRLQTLIPDELALRLVKLWLDYSVWDGRTLTRPTLGLPQGAVISPMLANLCLDTLDDRLLAEGIALVRYSDDFVILTKSRKSAERAYELTESILAELHLQLDEAKTRIARFSDGFRFLGVIFLKDLLLQPWRKGRPHLEVRASADALPPTFFPGSEHRPLHHYPGY